MQESELPERPRDELTSEHTPHETESEAATLSHLLQEQVFSRLSLEQPVEDPTARPLLLLSHLQHELHMKAYRERQDKALADRLTAWKKSVNNVELAYEIIAYPHLKDLDFRREAEERIRDALEHPDLNTQDYPHRAPIELTDEEVRTLSTLTQAAELPFDPSKRVYRFAELASLLEAERLIDEQSDRVRKAKQNARESGMRARADVEERLRLRKAEWDVEGSDESPEAKPPRPEN
jgi:hypothetical protein